MKKNIIIVIFILIIGLGLGILIYNYDDNNSNKNNELEQLLNNINKINKIFNSTNLNTANSYEDNNGIVCKEYIGDDVETYLKLLKETYVNPFFEDGYFQMVYDEYKDFMNRTQVNGMGFGMKLYKRAVALKVLYKIWKCTCLLLTKIIGF